VHLHSTGVGKALLAQLDDERITDILRRTGMPANTSHTITDRAAMLAEIERIRADGYAVDDEEQEVGVNCVAVAVVGAPTPTAISVSGPTARMGPEMLRRAVPLLGRAALSLAADLQTVRPSA
jgi:IclR family transcriptional regulator, acetate operon repressor